MSDSPYSLNKVSVGAVDYGVMNCADVDLGFGMDCTQNMLDRVDTIVSVGTPVVQRADGAALTAQDLIVLSVALILGGYKFGWGLQGQGNASRYFVTFPIRLASGSLLYRTITIRTTTYVG